MLMKKVGMGGGCVGTVITDSNPTGLSVDSGNTEVSLAGLSGIVPRVVLNVDVEKLTLGNVDVEIIEPGVVEVGSTTIGFVGEKFASVENMSVKGFGE